MLEVFATYKNSLLFPDQVEGASADMPLDRFSFILDFLISCGYDCCVLTGNEVLRHPELNDFLLVAERKKMSIIIETSGFPNGKINEIASRHKIAIKWKIYHPTVYRQGQYEQLLGNLDIVTKRYKIFTEAVIVVHDLSLDYSFIADFIREQSVNNLYLDILCKAFDRRKEEQLNRLQKINSNFFVLIKQAFEEGIKTTIGCVNVPCGFSDSEFGALIKMGTMMKKCLPYPGVLPDLKVYHCRALINESERNLASFKNWEGLLEYFFKRYGEIQVKTLFFEQCESCLSRRAEVCFGGCLLLKTKSKR